MAMGIFSFIETFFFLSLAVSFVLILLLVYHFKQRISLLERKYDTVGCIISDVAKEMTMMKCGFSPMMCGDGIGGSDGICGMSMSYSIPEMRMSRPTHHDDDNIMMVEEINDCSESDNDSQSQSESDNESDSDDDDGESECNDDDDDDARAPMSKIVVSDTDEPVEFEVESVEFEVVIPEEIVDVEVEIELSEEPHHEEQPHEEEEDMKKMSISSLKQLVLSKGLTHDSSKMKKSELLQLLLTKP